MASEQHPQSSRELVPDPEAARHEIYLLNTNDISQPIQRRHRQAAGTNLVFNIAVTIFALPGHIALHLIKK